jgi:hypothetical protein
LQPPRDERTRAHRIGEEQRNQRHPLSA